MQCDPESDRTPERTLADSEINYHPCEHRCAECCHDGVRVGHPGGIDVSNAAYDRFRGRPLNAEEVERDPGELHRLDGEQKRCDRN